MIVLCPKAISQVTTNYEGAFLFHYLKKKKTKAVVTNECWSALKYRIKKKYDERFDTEIAESKTKKHVAELRGWLVPENEIKDKFGRDMIPAIDYSIDVLLSKTKDLIIRKWAVITYFICFEISDYSNIKTTPRTIEKFFHFCLAPDSNSEEKRLIAEEFVKMYPQTDS